MELSVVNVCTLAVLFCSEEAHEVECWPLKCRLPTEPPPALPPPPAPALSQEQIRQHITKVCFCTLPGWPYACDSGPQTYVGCTGRPDACCRYASLNESCPESNPDGMMRVFGQLLVICTQRCITMQLFAGQ